MRESRGSRRARNERARIVRRVQLGAAVTLVVLIGSLLLVDWEQVQEFGGSTAARVIGIEEPTDATVVPATTTTAPPETTAAGPATSAPPDTTEAPTTTTEPEATTTTEPEGPRTLLFDEFNNFNGERWLPADYPADTNAEKQYYTPDNVSIRDGVLVLTAEQRAVGGRQYASGLVSSAGRFSFQYGTVEWRAMMPTGTGMWPALWLLGADCAGTFANGSQLCPTWPIAGSSEVDVLEMAGSQPNTAHFARHFNTQPVAPATHFSCDWNGPNLSAGWHTYGLRWSPDALVWTVDGQERCRTAENVPNEPMFLIMNLAVGGVYDGDPDGSTPLPQDHLIDWVRVTELG